MSTNIEDIKAKIRALFAKAASTEHEGEADLFLAKAEELMRKHQLELFELHTEDPLGFTKAEDVYQAGPPSYRYEVHNALARYYGCETIRWYNYSTGKKTWQLELCGAESSRVTTELMLPFIWQQVTKQAATVVERSGGMINKGRAVREVAKALTVRIFREIRARKATEPNPVGTCYALVVVDAITALVKQTYSDLKEGKSKTVNTIALARDAAAGINLNHQVDRTTQLRIE